MVARNNFTAHFKLVGATSTFSNSHAALITFQWITERNKSTPRLAELIWLTHYPTQRRVPRGRLAEPLDPAIEGVGDPPFPVLQQGLYGQLWPRGAPRWLQLHRERKISAQGPFSSMGEL